jgi:hypothetical protein
MLVEHLLQGLNEVAQEMPSIGDLCGVRGSLTRPVGVGSRTLGDWKPIHRRWADGGVWQWVFTHLAADTDNANAGGQTVRPPKKNGGKGKSQTPD